MFYIENYSHYANGETKQEAIDNLAKVTLKTWVDSGYTKGFNKEEQFGNYKGFAFAFMVESKDPAQRNENTGFFETVNGEELTPTRVCLV